MLHQQSSKGNSILFRTLRDKALLQVATATLIRLPPHIGQVNLPKVSPGSRGCDPKRCLLLNNFQTIAGLTTLSIGDASSCCTTVTLFETYVQMRLIRLISPTQKHGALKSHELLYRESEIRKKWKLLVPTQESE